MAEFRKPVPLARRRGAREKGAHWKADAAGLLILYALAVPLSPQFNVAGIPDFRLTDAILVLAVLTLLSTTGGSKELRSVWKSPPLLAPLVILATWNAFRLFMFPGDDYSSQMVGTFYLLKRVEYGVVFLVAYAVCVHPEACRRAVRALLVGAVGFNLLLIWEFHNFASAANSFRVSAFGADQPNQAAIFIVGILTLAAIFMQRSTDRPYKWVAAGVLLTGSAALLSTGSKEGLVSAIVAGFLLSVRGKQWGIVILTTVVGLCAWPFFPDSVHDRYSYMLVESQQTFQAVTIDPSLMPSAGSSSLAGRVLEAEYVFNEVLPDCFWTGNGLGSTRLGRIDDTYLFEWVSNGLLGLFLLGWVLLTIWQLIRRTARSKDPLLLMLAGAMECYFLICLLDGFASEIFYVIRPMEFFFLLLGMTAGREAYLTMKSQERVKLGIA